MKEKEEQSVETVLDQRSALDVKDTKRAIALRRRILFAGIILVTVCALAAVLIVTLCKVGEITVSETSLYDPQEIIALTGIGVGDNLFSYDSKKVEQKIRENYPYLLDVKVSRSLPSGVHIRFREELGDMCIQLGKDYYPIDKNQTVLKCCSSPDDGGVHRIVIVADRISRCVVGEKLQYRDTTLFGMVDEICRAVEANGVLEKIQTIDMTDKFDIVMDFDSRFEIKLGSTENLKYKIAMVLKVVEELQEEDRGEIDVRETSTAYVKLYNK